MFSVWTLEKVESLFTEMGKAVAGADLVFGDQNTRNLVTDLHCEQDSGAWVWPASLCDYTSEIGTPPVFTEGTPSMINDLNFSMFKSVILKF